MNSAEDSSTPKPSNPQRAKHDQETAESAGLTTGELDTLRKMLLAARDALARKVSSHLELAVPTESHLADDMDQASRDQEMGFSLLLAGNDLALTSEIEAALKRLADGTYGLCEGTDEPIGFRRLEARPWTRYSIGYQEQVERDQCARSQLR